MKIAYGDEECNVLLRNICDEPMYDTDNIVYLRDYVCVPLLICKYNKLQRLFYYTSKKTGYTTKEYKERNIVLFIPVMNNGKLDITNIKSAVLRFIHEADIMQNLLISCPDMLLHVEMSPVELLTLSSLFIINKNGNKCTHEFVY
jgi:hypothetical protein